MSDKWRSSQFDAQDLDPLGPLANLIDIMLVFACGLIAALVALSPELKQHFNLDKPAQKQTISAGKELAAPPESLQQQLSSGQGYESVGQVYRDPKTGKLILISEDE